jgi:hypothetical protein
MLIALLLYGIASAEGVTFRVTLNRPEFEHDWFGPLILWCMAAVMIHFFASLAYRQVKARL